MKIGENIKNKIKIIGISNRKDFLPITTGIETNKPNHAFLEKVKKPEKATEKRKQKEMVFF